MSKWVRLHDYTKDQTESLYQYQYQYYLWYRETGGAITQFRSKASGANLSIKGEYKVPDLPSRGMRDRWRDNTALQPREQYALKWSSDMDVCNTSTNFLHAPEMKPPLLRKNNNHTAIKQQALNMGHWRTKACRACNQAPHPNERGYKTNQPDSKRYQVRSAPRR